MNDRFKFRVWDKAEQQYNGNVFHLSISGELQRLSIAGGGFLETDPNRFVIEQCTGLKDKNGKLIYEGDIVCYDDTPYNGYATKKTGVIVYRKAEFCYKYSDCLGGLYQPLVPSDDFWQRKTEIIGNVHEMEVAE